MAVTIEALTAQQLFSQIDQLVSLGDMVVEKIEVVGSSKLFFIDNQGHIVTGDIFVENLLEAIRLNKRELNVGGGHVLLAL